MVRPHPRENENMLDMGKSWLPGLLLLALIGACTERGAQTMDAPPHPLVGRWSTDDVLVFYDSHERNLRARTFHITPADWSEVFGLEPRQVDFAADGTYWSEQRGVDGSVVERTTGRWAANQGTLTLIQLTPNEAQLRYEYEIHGGRLTLESRLDWDSDGAEDDFYVSRGRRLSAD
jgi:hypothetical protein